MRYVNINFGDYAKSTRFLSMAENGCYWLLLQFYYVNESPILEPDCYQISCAWTAKERAITDKILAKFFVKTTDGWIHERCDQEIAKMCEKADKCSDAAKKRWGK